VPQDAVQSFNWFSAAAAAGDVPAQRNLGFMYAQGVGVAQDNVSAAKWFLLAQERGDTQTAAAMSVITPPLTNAQLSEAHAEAQQWDAGEKAPP
jgi:hypothetical protein